MTANITALHGGRTRALVQRKGRKAHVASIAPGDGVWTGICGRYIPADGTPFWIHDAADHGEAAPDAMCADCRSITELVAWAVSNALAGATDTRKAATR